MDNVGKQREKMVALALVKLRFKTYVLLCYDQPYIDYFLISEFIRSLNDGLGTVFKNTAIIHFNS